MNKLTLALITIISFNSIQTASLVRRALTHAVSNRVIKTMVKPVSWPINKIVQTNFYKKHPWLVKGAAVCLTIVATRRAVQAYCQARAIKQEAQRPQALLEAAWDGQLAKVKALIKAGAQVNIQENTDRWTPLVPLQIKVILKLYEHLSLLMLN